ncbi:MAG: polysaccharide deacetylase family protein [Salinivirgaceae bacterium]|nr:polysaccharide deacetylase family protein [Salinivirgaceae bacterium]
MGVINKPPQFVRRLMDKCNWKLRTSERTIFLTFDDGPTPEITDWVLCLLKKYNAKATFFCLGRNVDHYPEIYARILANGHSVGNHTYSHLNGWKSSFDEYSNDVVLASEYIDSKLFRFPYGRITPKQYKYVLSQGYKIVLWDVMPEDYNKRIAPEKCFSLVKRYIEDGSIIVFHDSKKASRNLQYTLPLVLEYYTKLGFKFEKINLSDL